MPAAQTASNFLPSADLTAAELLDLAIRNTTRMAACEAEMKRCWMQADFAMARGEFIVADVESARGDRLQVELDHRKTAMLNITRRLAA